MRNDSVLDAADLRAIENLLNCYCREIAAPRGTCSFIETRAPGVAHLRLSFVRPVLGSMIEVAVTRPSLTGGFECLGAPRFWSAGRDSRELGWRELSEVLIAEVEALEGTTANPELIRLIANSVEVTRALLSHPRRLVNSYIDSEQALTFGHPFHPSPKSREGFNQEELERYSPELGARFKLRWFEVPCDLVAQDAIEGSAAVPHVIGLSGLRAGPGRALLPLHPWQASFVRGFPFVAAELKAGEWIDRGESGPEWFATSSVRTLYSAESDYFLKTSLNVRITNCIRRNAPHELACALRVARWMGEEAGLIKRMFPAFKPLGEPAYLTLDVSSKNIDSFQVARIGESFGVMLRDARPLKSDPHVLPLVAAALFGNRSEGRRHAHRLIAEPTRSDWLFAYFEQLLHPMLYLFFERGLMFEPHLQNIVVGIEERGAAPRSIFLRDFDNAKTITEWFDPERWQGAPQIEREELSYPIAKAWPRFIYCLLVNNAAEVISALAGGSVEAERAYWKILRDSLESYLWHYGSNRSERLVRELLNAPSLPTKANFLTRVFKRPDRNAGFFPVPNPLSRNDASKAWLDGRSG